MAVTQNSLLFLHRHTLPDYLVCTVFEQEGLFPIIGMDLCKEILLSCSFHSDGISSVARKLAM